MGLCNAPATFQTLMNRIIFDCIDVFLVVYMDDLLIFSKNEEDHLKHLDIVLSRLKSECLYVSPTKCEFMKKETEFLGLVVGVAGIRVSLEKTAAVTKWPKPTTLTELRSFISLLQFFRRFIKNFLRVAAPLTALTRKQMGIAKWDRNCSRAFDTLKKAITTAPVLMPPSWNKPFHCHVDASQTAVGGTVTQKDEQGH